MAELLNVVATRQFDRMQKNVCNTTPAALPFAPLHLHFHTPPAPPLPFIIRLNPSKLTPRAARPICEGEAGQEGPRPGPGPIRRADIRSGKCAAGDTARGTDERAGNASGLAEGGETVTAVTGRGGLPGPGGGGAQPGSTGESCAGGGGAWINNNGGGAVSVSAGG